MTWPAALAAEFYPISRKTTKSKNFHHYFAFTFRCFHRAKSISGRFIWDAGFRARGKYQQILDALIASHLVVYDEKDLQTEHGIYNIIPFIAHYFPDAQIVPIALTSHNSHGAMFCFGRRAGKIFAVRRRR